jgi:two-component system, chemotaxis family, protein-glutamate methylesterase/glutaminase
MTKARVLIVDDSAFARKVVREILEADSRFEVVGIARDGLDGLEKIAELKPDVVTLDLVMPNLDGLGLLESLAKLGLASVPRVVVVSMTDSDSDLAVAALQRGAFDLVHKPTALATDRLFELAGELREKVALAAAATVRRPFGAQPVIAPAPAPLPAPRLPVKRSGRRIVVIGASTGGPQALTSLLGAIPKDFPVPIAVALHMPLGYTEALAKRLDQACAIEVLEASEGLELRPGRALIARAGMHLKIRPGEPAVARLDLVPIDKAHRPSVDVLFASAAEAFGQACVGVVLTGMGDDGTIGSRAIRGAGGVVLTEAESSCVVYGMPRAVKEAGMSSREAPLEGMLNAILSYV